MFDITGKDISELNDTDLRCLAARLCEAEVRRNGLPVSSVTAGGDQNAGDGGLDVRVELEEGNNISGFIPRANTGFQVKVPDMPSSEIMKEMRPEGALRPVIRELISKSGAYIIVSAKGSTTDGALKRRRAAMSAAVHGVPNVSNFKLDFYDRDRLASWVRLYPGVAAWVRERLRKPLQGWQPFGNWSAPMEAPEVEYLRDGTCRLRDGRFPREGGLTIEEGIRRIRGILSRHTGTVRLIGLSGVGKTRLVQALFDGRIGDAALSHSDAIYTDIADEPTPSPRDLIRHLVDSQQPAILIVDNCQPTTHRALATACAVPGSKVGLLTVEYDVGDDDPEGTEVFRLEPSSDDVIVQLLQRREPHVSQVDHRRIAEFSGGNARVALALARTVRKNECVATLSDQDLFSRLFHQRHRRNDTLHQAAEACSLVYSFDGETWDGKDAELPILAELAGLSIDELYRHIQELKARDLLQRRSKWRAVLPQALANKLARHALDRLMPDRIAKVMTCCAPERLLRSFSRRLGYLHDCGTAQDLVGSWLVTGGWLADVGTLNPLELEIFFNVAPVSPSAVLDALERALDGAAAVMITDVSHPNRYKIASLLRSLAYEAANFRRAALLLVRFAIAEPSDHNHNATSGQFKELFHLYLSGTYATAQQRLEVVDALLARADGPGQECGLAALAEMLEACHFRSSHNFEFGARSRDFGWQPNTQGEVSDWYRAVIRYMSGMINVDSPMRAKFCAILAENFRWLWLKANSFDDLVVVVSSIAEKGFWPDGWISVRSILRLDAVNMETDILRQLKAIEERLRPTQLLELTRTYVFSAVWNANSLDVADCEDDEPSSGRSLGYEKAGKRTESLGREVATNVEVLMKLLPDLVRGKDGGRRWSFGMGLANGATNLRTMWTHLTRALSDTPDNERNIQVLQGFLAQAACVNFEEASSFLDHAVSDPILGPWFPFLQCSVTIDQRGINRLLAAIHQGGIFAWAFGQLAYGKVTDPIPASDLRCLLTVLSMLPDGLEVAVNILYMRLHSMREAGSDIDHDLVECGRKFLLQHEFGRRRKRIDHELAALVDACCAQDDAAECVRDVCKKMAAAFSDYRASPYDYGDVLKNLLLAQPTVFLDTFLTSGGNRAIRCLFGEARPNYGNPLADVSLDVLLAWANIDAPQRFPALASAVNLFTSEDSEPEQTLSARALELLEAAPDKEAVLSCFGKQFDPSSWSGSLSDLLDRRRTAIQSLVNHANPIITDWTRKWDQRLAEMIAKERASYRETDQSFE